MTGLGGEVYKAVSVHLGMVPEFSFLCPTGYIQSIFFICSVLFYFVEKMTGFGIRTLLSYTN